MGSALIYFFALYLFVFFSFSFLSVVVVVFFFFLLFHEKLGKVCSLLLSLAEKLIC